MSQFFVIHPDNPQSRLIKQAATIVQEGGVIVYPTDSAYAIGCQLANKDALERIRSLRQLDEKHNFTLVCRDLSELSTYAIVNNPAFRLLKAHTPGPYTFILNATREVPRRLLQPKRNTIGLRVPDSKIVRALLNELNEPLMSVTLSLPEQEYPFIDAQDIYETLGKRVDLVIDGGPCGMTPTTVVDLVSDTPTILRVGKGDPRTFI
ncbi:MAG: L-threonylcarbamoyladenylate synthase [Gammaproteobacteria bacterium]|nr:L-threonylcarbamoyladenylate synthase [Gammaproteobacteria bacterium]